MPPPKFAAPTVPAPTPFRAWWMAARPATLFVAVVPVIVGAALAWREAAALDWRVVLVALAAAVFIQIGTNLFNDVGDFERGADGADRLGPPRPTSLGWLSPADVRRAAATSFGLAMVLGAWLVSVGGWPIFVIGIASVVAGVAYTGGPKPIAYSATGEIFVFLFFGLVATGGSYYLQTGGVTWPVITAGAMLGALAAAVLVVNNYRDIESDRRAGKITLAVRIGRPASRVEFALLVAVPFAMLPLFGRAVGLGWPLFLPLATAPFAAWLIRDLARAPVGVALNGVLKRTAVLEFLFGMLLAAALAV